MFERLGALEEKYSQMEQQLLTPELYSDPAASARLAKEMKELGPVVETYRAMTACERELKSARELFSDPEMGALAREEADSAESRLERLKQELRILLLPKDPNDGRGVIVEIRAGVGGEESALFAADLYRMYVMYAESRRWSVEIANENDTELGGIREISFLIEGEGAYSRLKFESGVHRVQRVPETETGGRIHTSTATVAVLPQVDEVEFHLNPAELQIDTFRSTGAGGQKVNKTESAIRITHLPTGTVVECQDERSQYKNKARAMSILASRLYEAERQKQAEQVAAQRRSQVGTGMRNERIRTYNFPQGRVTDHRIGLTLYQIDSVMNGGLDALIEPLITADQAEKLKAVNDDD
jgi:peptide chain release factor 1